METENEKMNSTVAFRLPDEVIAHYQEQANKERRKLGQVLRFALIDHMKAQLRKNSRASKAA
jgi:hypothetical protein